MEILMDKVEFQVMSTEFRRISSRLLKTDVDDGLENLKRLLSFIESTPIIWDFIKEHNTLTFDIEKEIQKREMFKGYHIEPDKNYEISFIYQLLKFCAEHRQDYVSICYWYGSSRKFQDMVDSFNSRVVHLLVSHIKVYLKGGWLSMGDSEKISINVNGGQVAIAQGQGTVNATQNNYNGQGQTIKELAEEFYKLIEALDMDKEEKEDTKEIIEVAVAEVVSEKPKRSLVKHAIEKIEYAGKLGIGLNGLNTIGHQLVEILKNFI